MVSQYFTKLKSVWDELCSYKPVYICECGALRPWLDYQEIEYVKSFLMGLNDSLALIRGQLLLMEPIPPINKVFSFVVQEEKQREVGITAISTAPMAFAVRSDASKAVVDKSKQIKKDHPVCAHCGVVGLTMDIF